MIARFIHFWYQTPELAFWACALFGSTLFLLRLVLSLFGSIAEEFGDISHSEYDDGDVYHSASGSFKIFTIHSISGFLMMFGWVGLACTKQSGYQSSIALLIAFVMGICVMLLTALIFKGASLLVSSGSQFNIQKTIGLVGTVYQYIPAHGQGKVHLVVDGVIRELLAQSVDHMEIESFSIVEVVQVLDHELVVVKKKET